MLTFGELQTAVGNLIERPDSSFNTKIKEFINTRYRHIVSLRPWMSLLRQLTVTATVGRDYIITPQEVEEVIDIHQRETPAIIALQRYFALLHRSIDSITQQDSPINAFPMGEVGIFTPMTASGINFSSSSSSDITQTVTVRGYSGGTNIPQVETINLNGTSGVGTTLAFSTSEGYEPMFSKSGDTVGTVTVTTGIVSTTIAYLAPKEREARYKKWRLWPTPNASIPIYVTYKRRITPLSNSNDVPELECDNAIILGSFAMALEEKRQMGKSARIWGVVDANGHYPPGTYMAEIESLIAKEPQFSQSFNDQFFPLINRENIDQPIGYTGIQLRSSS